MSQGMDPRKMGAKGGKARARSLSPEERSRIARKAASARWAVDENSEIPRAICGGDTPLRLGDEIEIPCYVLDDERRVLSLLGMQKALGLSAGGDATTLAEYVANIDPNAANANELAVRLNDPIVFQPQSGGKPAHGYEATLLADICDTILEARRSGSLTNTAQQAVARRAELLVRGWARVGIIALVDEATGFEKFRKRLALAEILDKYLDDNLNIWTKTFSNEFYEHFFRLKKWDYDNLKAGDVKPAEVGRFTREEVYRRLHPGIVDELEKNNPYVVPGRRRHKHHQWLSREIGHPALEKHIAVIVTIMKLSDDWLTFEYNLQRALPKPSETEFFDFIKDDATVRPSSTRRHAS